MEIIEPKSQLCLFGLEHYFNFFTKIFQKGKAPNSILLSGPKGSGKSTFAYHLTNYLLSISEKKKYSINNFVIDENNLSYKLVATDIHPNFFLIENKLLEKDIKIEQIRNLLKFLNKSTYSKDLKIVIIDNAENLNINSSNALLKALEEPRENTFFFIIHNSSSQILHTIKSRCTEFKFVFTALEKKNIFLKLLKQYKKDFDLNDLAKDYYFDTPGNSLKYFLTIDNAKIKIKDNTLKCIFYFIEKYKGEKNSETLSFLSFFIEKFYYELCLSNNKNFDIYIFNQVKILRKINEMNKFNLDEKNIFIWIKNILQNEAK